MSTVLASQRFADLPEIIRLVIPDEFHGSLIVSSCHYQHDRNWTLQLRAGFHSNNWNYFIKRIEEQTTVQFKSKPHGTEQPNGVKNIASEAVVCIHADHESGHHLSRRRCAAEGEIAKPRTTTKSGAPVQTKVTGSGSKGCKTLITFVEVAPLKTDKSGKITDASRKRLANNPYIVTHPSLITIKWVHEHNIGVLAALRWHKLNKDVKDAMARHLEAEGTVPAAANAYRNELEELYPTRPWLELSADRSLCPTMKDWYHLADSLQIKQHGDRGGESMHLKLKELSSKHPDQCFYRESRGRNGELLWSFVLQTPVMRRVFQEVSDAKDILFTDSTSSCDLLNTALTLMVSASSAGALPVAVALHSSQTADCYKFVVPNLLDYFNYEFMLNCYLGLLFV